MKIEVTAKRKPVLFEIESVEEIGPFNHSQRFTCLGARVFFLIKNDKKCMQVAKVKESKLVDYTEKAFGVKISGSEVFVELTDESFSLIEAMGKRFELEYESYKNALEARARELPVRYFMHNFLDWGDYSITMERSIEVYRDALPEEAQNGYTKLSVKSYNLNDNGIGEFADEWKSDCEKIGLKDVDVEISKEMADKWIGIHAIVKEQQEAVEKAKEQKLNEKREAERIRVEKCFEEARTTGNPVELYSLFLTGNDIPRQFRDEDSDMGNLITYAMPDGSKKQKFSHAY